MIGIVVLAYIILTLVIGVPMLFGVAVWHGVIFFLGTALGFAAGAGVRDGIRRKHPSWLMIAIGLALLMLGAGMIFHARIFPSLFGFEFSGDNWPFLGAFIGYLGAQPEFLDRKERGS